MRLGRPIYKRKLRINYRKVLLVMFITVLIWVWADKAQDTDYNIRAIIKPDRAVAPDLWITFDRRSSLKVDLVKLRGPASKIDQIRNDLREGSGVREFYFAPQDVGLSEPGEYPLDICDFLRKSGQLIDLGVTAIYSEPNTVQVQISRLVKKAVTIRVVRKDGTVIEAKKIEPETVEMMVPQTWGRERLVADAVLTDSEINQSRTSPVEVVATIRYSPDEVRRLPGTIKVSLPAAIEDLKQYPVTGATIGFVLSHNLVGQYKPELLNYSDIATFYIQATAPAKAAYDEQAFKMQLFILDGDEQNTAEVKREVVYNFPREFVREGKIRLDQVPAVARFRLVPVTPPPQPTVSP